VPGNGAALSKAKRQFMVPFRREVHFTGRDDIIEEVDNWQ
jgi:hypothetical protein